MSEEPENYIEDFVEEPEDEEDFNALDNIEMQSDEVAKYGKKKEKNENLRQKFDSAEYMMKKEQAEHK
jgi:replicative superfamily II helicase